MVGRKRGSKNKKTLLAADELLLKLDINPIEKLIHIAEPDDASVEQQIRCWQEVVYTYTKLKSQEIYIEPEPVKPIGRPMEQEKSYRPVHVFNHCIKILPLLNDRFKGG